MNKFDKLRPVGIFVFQHRGTFSAVGTFLVLYPWLKRPQPIWKEFEKDFRMYDQAHRHKKRKKTKPQR